MFSRSIPTYLLSFYGHEDDHVIIACVCGWVGCVFIGVGRDDDKERERERGERVHVNLGRHTTTDPPVTSGTIYTVG